MQQFVYYFQRVSDGKYFESYPEKDTLNVCDVPVCHEMTLNCAQMIRKMLQLLTDDKWVIIDTVTMIKF